MQDQKPKENKNLNTFDGCVLFDEFKKSLGPEADRYTNEEIEKMRILCDRIADLMFTTWLKERNSGIVIPEK